MRNKIIWYFLVKRTVNYEIFIFTFNLFTKSVAQLSAISNESDKTVIGKRKISVKNINFN